MSAFEYTGGSLRGGSRTEVSSMDEYDRKEYLRKNRRRPIEETISDIGEGRGTYTIPRHTLLFYHSMAITEEAH